MQSSCGLVWFRLSVRPETIKNMHFTQVSQLSRQGVGRFTGSCRASTVLGICESDETYTEARDTSANAEPLGRVKDEQDQFWMCSDRGLALQESEAAPA